MAKRETMKQVALTCDLTTQIERTLGGKRRKRVRSSVKIVRYRRLFYYDHGNMRKLS